MTQFFMNQRHTKESHFAPCDRKPFHVKAHFSTMLAQTQQGRPDRRQRVAPDH